MEMEIPALWNFFTAWQLVLLGLASLRPFGWIAKVLNLPFLSLFVLLGGLYVSWIRPMAYFVPMIPVGTMKKRKSHVWVLDSWWARVSIDLMTHVLPLVYAIRRFGPMRWTRRSTIGTLVLLGVYLVLFPVHTTYKISVFDMIFVFFTAVIFSEKF
jgi:hypothetical protein